MPAEVFISYSSNDQDKVVKLADKLRSSGVSIWVDESGIGAATLWSKEIAGAIKGCKVLVLMVTPNSVKSENVVKEVTLAAEQRKKILPVVLEPTQIPEALEYHLAGIQHLDVNGMSPSASAEEILPTLQRLLGMESEETIAAGHAVRGSRRRSVNIWTDWRLYAVSLLVSVVYIGLSKWFRPDPEAPQPRHWEILTHNHEPFDRDFEVSPDGTKLLYGTRNLTEYRIRDLTTGNDKLLEGFQPAVLETIPLLHRPQVPSFSKDGSYVCFQQDRAIVKVPVSGGQPIVITQMPERPSMHMGADWSGAGHLVFAHRRYPLRLVSDEGGTLTNITELENGHQHLWPQFLPNGKHVLFISNFSEGVPEVRQVEVVNILTKERTRLGIDSPFARYSASGHLLHASGSDLYATRFSARDLRTYGDSEIILEGVLQTDDGNLQLDLADDGTLVYLKALDESIIQGFYWVESDGSITNATKEFERLDRWDSFALSPNEKRIAYSYGKIKIFELNSEDGYDWPLYIPEEMDAFHVKWAPDGESIYFHSNENGIGKIWRTKVTRQKSQPELILKSDKARVLLGNISADGKSLVLAEEEKFNPDHYSILRVPLPNGGPVETLLPGEFSRFLPRISPNGDFLAYNWRVAGNWEIYVKHLSGSRDAEPVFPGMSVTDFDWSKGGNDLYFGRSDPIFSSKITVDESGLKVAERREAFTFPEKLDVRQWAPTRDTNRFLVLGWLRQDNSTNAPALRSNAFSVISNFHSILNEKVPVGKE